MAREDYENYNEEWKSCRETAAKFDNTLIDLRKYGFTIITGLLTAGSFLGFSEPTISLQVGVIIVTMTLIVILYWMDIYYQNLLYGSVLRTNFLEIFRLRRGLSFYISKLYGRSGMGAVLHLLYAGFLIAAFVLGMFAANLSDNSNLTTSTNISNNKINISSINSTEISFNLLTNSSMPTSSLDTSKCKFPLNLCDESLLLYISLGLGSIAMGVIFLFFDQVRAKNGKIINKIIELRKNELDNLGPAQKESKIWQAENDIIKVLTKRISRLNLWSLARKNNQEFLTELDRLTQ